MSSGYGAFMPTKDSTSQFVPRTRKVRILATLGPASDSPAMIRKLVEAGADAFRLNMSHGNHADHEKRIAAIRALEAELERPTTILADLQGPKLRVGKFQGDKAELKNGQAYSFDRDETPGDENRVCLPHPELFGIMERGQRLLFKDGKIRLKGNCATKNGSKAALEATGAYSPTTFTMNAKISTTYAGVPLSANATTTAKRISETCPAAAPAS